MLTLFQNMDPLVLDVIVISILVLIVALAAIRGIRRVSVNVLLLSIALFLGFCPYTNSLKKVIGEKIINLVELAPAGSTNVQKFAVSMLSSLVNSLILFLVFYLLLFSITTLIIMLIKRAKKIGNKPKSTVGRVFAGLISLVYSLALCVVLLLSFNNNLTGMKSVVEKSSVTKLIIDTSEKLLNKKDSNLTDKIVIKIYNGDILLNVEEKTIAAYQYIDSKLNKFVQNKKYIGMLNDENIKADEAKIIIEERIQDLHKLSIVSIYAGKQNESVSSSFIALAEEWITTMNRTVVSKDVGKISLVMDELAEIRKSLLDAGVKEVTLALFDEITAGK